MKKLLLAALATAVLRGMANAHDVQAGSLRDNLSASYQLMDLHYAEPSDTCALAVCTNAPEASYFDRESGYINGFRLSASGLMWKDRIYGHVDYERASGYILYRGFTQSGTPIPNGVSGAVISDYAARLGAAFASGDFVAVPFVEYGHHAWHRILGAGTAQSYTEDYRHDYVGLGALLQVEFTAALAASIYAMAGQTVNPTITVPALGFAQSLGSSALVKVGATVDVRLSRAMGLYAGVRYTRFSYGQSAPQQSGGLVIMEPQSDTVIASYEGGLRFFF